MLSLVMDSVTRAARRSKKASLRLQSSPTEMRNRALGAIADHLLARKAEIVRENETDLSKAERSGVSPVLLKRLGFGEGKIEEAVEAVRSVAMLEDPVGRVLEKRELDKGLILERVTCPIGVIGVVFESRPDALVQISSLCVKSGNAVLLKGGSEAERTNKILADTISEAIASVDDMFADAVQLISSRGEFQKLLSLNGLVDLIIPRGSNELVRKIMESTSIPVLGHAAGVCHTYVDEEADVDMAVKVCYDAKVQYPAVCNAMETLLVHEALAPIFLPRMASEFAKANVELRGDARASEHIDAKAATEEDWSREYNDLVLNVKVVSSLEEAIDHINTYGSHHTDAIVTSNEGKAKRFMDCVDSSSVMWNCSTRFADGYRYGLGAEVGISTGKIHARGPVGLEGLATYKYRIKGSGQVVADYVGPGAKKFTHRKLR